jgi:hypothetical protein
VVTIAVGVLCMLLGYRATVAMLVVTTLLGAAATMFIGAANIQPAHLFLGFVAAVALFQRREVSAAIRALSPPRPGFWLVCLVLYGAFSAYLMPRILAGGSLIYPIGTSEYEGAGLVPLGPVSGNLTQTVYLIADLICFALISAVASTRAGFGAIAGALLAYAAGNVLFALLDLGTYATGTQGILELIRNARYTLHHEEEIRGLKRIVGSFTEASSFAGATLAAFGFTGTMWLCGRRPVWTGTLALASFALLILSTSSTGLLAAPIVLIILYMTAFGRCGLHRSARVSAIAVLSTPPIVVIVALVVLLNEKTFATIHDYVDVLILSKSSSDSGIERGSWNAAALQNFVDSWGFGVGLGTARTSSFALAILSHVGIPGAILFSLFTVTALLHRRGTPRTFPSDIRLAARNGCFSIMLGSVASGSTLDLGLLFFVLAGVACAEPERETTNLLGSTNARYTGASI